MKTKYMVVAALLAVVHATDSWTSQPLTNEANKKTNYLLGLKGPAVNQDPQTVTAADLLKPTWKIETQTFLDRDTGIQWLRVTHTLDMLISADQTVLFDLSFGTDFDPWVDPKGIMIEDSGRCTVAISTLDTRFWTQTASDFFYTCNNYACTASTAASTFRSGLAADYSAQQDSQSDWTAPVTDDDPDNPFCKPLTLGDPAITYTYQQYQQYSCEQIKCIHQRPLDTGDDSQDFQFNTAEESKMKIWKGRSSITITSASDTGTPVAIYGNLGLPASSGVMGELLITVDIGAAHLMASSTAVLIFASQLL